MAEPQLALESHSNGQLGLKARADGLDSICLFGFFALLHIPRTFNEDRNGQMRQKSSIPNRF